MLSVLREKGVVLRSSLTEEENHNFVPDDLSNYRVARAGDLVVNKMKAWQGSVGIAPTDGIVSPAYFVFDLSGITKEYTYRLLRCRLYADYFARSSDGVRIGQWDLSIAQMKRIPVVVPPVNEQAEIVRYLEIVDRGVRRFIRNRRRLIEVLNEQKQAIINRAVTRGLDPNAPLKPSGIDWLGDIPRHWEVKRLKFVAKIIYGSSPHNSTYNTDGIGTVLVNGPDEYSREDFGLTRSVKWTTAPVKFAPKGALLFCLRGSTTGRLNICHTDLSIGRGVAALIPRENQHYFSYAMMALRGHLKATFRGSTFPSVTSNHLNNYWLPQPPIIEQEYIAKYIDEATMALNQAIDRANREIDLIREYRTRLIADVVTGKVDVRGLAPDEPPSADEQIDEGIDDEEMLGDDEPELVEEAADADD